MSPDQDGRASEHAPVDVEQSPEPTSADQERIALMLEEQYERFQARLVMAKLFYMYCVCVLIANAYGYDMKYAKTKIVDVKIAKQDGVWDIWIGAPGEQSDVVIGPFSTKREAEAHLAQNGYEPVREEEQ